MKSGFLLDTNIPSEQTQPRPNPLLGAWMFAQREDSLYLSAITVGELNKGINLLPAGNRRTQLEHWLENELIPRFADRILSVTPAIGRTWGTLTAKRQLAGKPLSMADGLIAATAIEHNLTVVTRNVKDFAGLGVAFLNPWEMTRT